jgi:hypothetical protein
VSTDLDMKIRLTALASTVKAAQDEADQRIVGRQVRVVSNFNGQPFGRSRKSLKGELLRVAGVALYGDGRYSFWTDDPRVNAGFDPEDVEFI